MEDMGDVKSTVKGMDVVLYRIEEMDENIKHLQTMMDKLFRSEGPMQKGD